MRAATKLRPFSLTAQSWQRRGLPGLNVKYTLGDVVAGPFVL